MTPRERVRVALRHQEPDRVPIDNNGIVSSIHEAAYANLLSRLGVQGGHRHPRRRPEDYPEQRARPAFTRRGHAVPLPQRPRLVELRREG